MKNKVAKTNFILLTVIALIALVFCVISFDIPGTTNTFNGFARAFNTGLDFGDGTSAIFTVEKDSFYTGNDWTYDASNIVQKLIDAKYGDGKAEIVGDSKIKITVPDTSISSEVIITSLEMKAEEGETAETYVTGADIKKVEYRMNGTTHGVYIKFNKAGTKKFADLTRTASQGSGNIVIYINRDYDNAQTISISEEITTGYCYLSSASKTSAQSLVKTLNNTRYGLNLSQEGSSVTVHSTFETWQKVVFAVIAGVLVVGSFALLIAKYKHLGLLGSLVLTLFAEINIIAFALIPSIRLTLVSYFGMMFGYVLALALLVYIFEMSKKEFASGKKLPASLKSGYSKSIMPIIDAVALTGIMCVVAFIFGNATLCSFAAPLSIMLVSLLATHLGLYRWFVYMYLSINPGKGNMLNFKRKEGVNEIK